MTSNYLSNILSIYLLMYQSIEMCVREKNNKSITRLDPNKSGSGANIFYTRYLPQYQHHKYHQQINKNL